MEIPGPPSHPPPNESQRAVDDEIRRTGDEIRRLEKHLRDLKSERNARAEISKLPEDVLLEIFKNLRASECPWSPTSLNWIKITFVCRHWRNAALGAHTLWASPPTERLDVALILLERSRNCDIDLIFDKKSDPRTIEAILSTDNIKRIRTLDVRDTEGPAMANIQNIMKTGGGSQRLQHLKLAITYSGRSNDFTFSAASFGPLDQLLSLNLSTLRCDWDFPPLSNLTQLDLGDVHFTGPAVSLNMLLECLRGMPALQRLELPLRAFGNDIPQTMTQELVELSRLTTLRLYGIPQNLEYLLSHLILPRLDCLFINCTNYHEEEHEGRTVDDCCPLVKAISNKLIGGDFATLDRLMTGGQNRLLLKSQDKPDSMLDFWLPRTDDVRGWLFLLKDAIMQFNYTVRGGIQFLTYYYFFRFSLSDDEFFLLFGQLHSLTAIEVHGSMLAKAIINSLSIPAGHEAVTTPVPFPKLFGIHFFYAKLSPHLLATFQAVLQQRSAVGASIRSVEFTRTENTEGELTVFKDIVPEVIISMV